MTKASRSNEIQCKPIICSTDMFYNLRIVLHGPNKIPFYKLFHKGKAIPLQELFHNEGKS
jgi:hypothetical protein